jgi:hypothetical protein
MLKVNRNGRVLTCREKFLKAETLASNTYIGESLRKGPHSIPSSTLRAHAGS